MDQKQIQFAAALTTAIGTAIVIRLCRQQKHKRRAENTNSRKYKYRFLLNAHTPESSAEFGEVTVEKARFSEESAEVLRCAFS